MAQLAPLLRDAAVVVAPLLEGAGTRVKIVEAWSQGKAVVTTAKGVEGLPWNDGAVAVADGAEAFADRLSELMTDAERRRSMGGAGAHAVPAATVVGGGPPDGGRRLDRRQRGSKSRALAGGHVSARDPVALVIGEFAAGALAGYYARALADARLARRTLRHGRAATRAAAC